MSPVKAGHSFGVEGGRNRYSRSLRYPKGADSLRLNVQYHVGIFRGSVGMPSSTWDIENECCFLSARRYSPNEEAKIHVLP